MFLPDYFAFIPECVGTLQEREDALDAVNVLLEQLREKQEAATKTAAALGPAAQADKRVVAMNVSIHALQVDAVQLVAWTVASVCLPVYVASDATMPSSDCCCDWP